MIIVSGENVADLLPAESGLMYTALGGGPANTAVAAARLGAEVSFAARFGSDAFGTAFRNRLSDAGVDLRHAVQLDASSALALTRIDADGSASYDFWLRGAADFAATDLPEAGPDAGEIRHIGSLAAYWPPGADVAERWIERAPGTVTFDVNLRSIVLGHQPDAVRRLERLVRRADVVKASDEDLRMAFPDVAPEETARRWLDGGGLGAPTLIVLTLGAEGAVGLLRGGRRVHVPAPRVEVVDTIGAGDAAMGALLTRLDAVGLDAVCEHLEETLRFAVAVAALACTRAGAYAPSAEEVDAYLGAATALGST
ncbi:carbohydrate kinase [Actinospica sp.]|uniref:carbohydrate kinase family protein n=1 Tax=Actinospica sp. TaxID=1872142 RepID=UPI002C44BF06|nr:carbohydrate kinase [Actinospica sp.]HWG28734.1 carbohydrate kinase [Actinospica sp.]